VTKSPSSKQKAVRPQQQSSASDDMLHFAADTAAYIVAEAENKSYLAVEAVKETERISRLAEENDAMLLLAEQLYEQCNVDKYSFLLVTEFSSSMFLND
jgi:myb proto-oncogene protein